MGTERTERLFLRFDDPSYRSLPARANGRYQNIAYIQTLIIPPVLLEERHRHLAQTVDVREPVAQLEALVAGGSKSLQRNWPGNLVLYYQDKLTDNAHLTDAWQELAPSAFAGILDTIRTRVLELSLDLAEEAGQDLGQFGISEPQHARQIIHNHLYGSGQFVSIGNENQIQHVEQLQQITLVAGDRPALDRVLRQLGLGDVDLAELSNALPKDSKADQITSKLKDWTIRAAKKGYSGQLVGKSNGHKLWRFAHEEALKPWPVSLSSSPHLTDHGRCTNDQNTS